MIIRDSKGHFLAACNATIDHAFDVLTTEATALKHGLPLAHSIGCNQILINLDCMEVINTMKNAAVSHGVAAGILMTAIICKTIRFGGNRQ